MPGFLRVFRCGKPGVVTLLLSQELLGDRELLLHLPRVSVLLWDGLLQKKLWHGLSPEGLWVPEGPLSILWEGRSSFVIFWSWCGRDRISRDLIRPPVSVGQGLPGAYLTWLTWRYGWISTKMKASSELQVWTLQRTQARKINFSQMKEEKKNQ